MKDLIIGAASNYTWNDLKYWVNSIKASGFEGDVAVVGRNIDKETQKTLTEKGVIVKLYEGDTGLAPHVEKFFFVWEYLGTAKEEYNRVIVTDTRDVIFQKIPDFTLDERELFIGAEGLRFKDEPWGSTNYMQAFGPYFYDRIKETPIYNVGVIMGQRWEVRSLMMQIFQLSFNRPIKVCDQASLNFIIWELHTFDLCTRKDFVIHLGTTPLAIEAGSGDIGALAMKEKTVRDRYYETYFGPSVALIGNRVDINYDNPLAVEYITPCIVHQWDRVPSIKKIVEEKYGA